MEIPETMLQLAPQDLENYRQDRYGGGGFSVTLRNFTPEDAALLIRLYSTIKKIYDLWLYMKDEPNYELMESQIVKELGSEQFRTSVQAIGSSTYDLYEPSPLLRKVIHDIRGGALSVLVGLATMLKMYPSNGVSIHQAITMARDHAKLMRNAIEDIDPVVRLADESIKVHPIREFVDKWQGLSFEIAKKPVAIQVNCAFDGNVTNRCLETSAVDRILYNYVNNAARFTADNRVIITIFSVRLGLVRWVVQNLISERHKQWLHENIGADLRPLFRGGITRGGHGIGLSNCTDFVAASFGIESNEEALEKKYLGAKVIDDQYYAWFHWPAFVAEKDEPICNCAE